MSGLFYQLSFLSQKFLYATSADPDQMAHFAASDLSIHWLPRTSFRGHKMYLGFLSVSKPKFIFV